MSNEIIVGLDIGTTKIACFIGQRDEQSGKVRILGYGKVDSSNSVEYGVVKNVRDTAISIGKAVKIASDQASVNVEEVYVGIAGQHIKSRQNQGSIIIPASHTYITEEDIERMKQDQYKILLNPGEEIIHVFPQSFIVDNDILGSDINPVGVTGHQLQAIFHIVTGNTANLDNIRESVHLAGLRIKDVVLEPIASAYATLDESDKAAGVALVDIGGGTTDIAIFQEGIIRHTSVLPLDGNEITNDINDVCHILKHHAELLKTKYGSCLPDAVNENDIVAVPGFRTQAPREVGMRTLASIIKARTETILDQVDFEIKESGMDKQLIAGIVLTGGGAQMRHIKELTEFITSTDTRIGLPDEHLVKDTPKELIHPMYSTGIGLLLYGIEDSERNDGRHNSTDSVGMTNEMPAQAEAEPVAPPSATGESPAAPSPKKPKGPRWNDKLRNYFDRIFVEPDIDPDKER